MMVNRSHMRQVGALVLGVAFSAQAFAKSDAVAAGQSATATAMSAPKPPLAELPKLEPVTYPEPGPSALKDLDAALALLTAEDARTRTNALSTIVDATPSYVPAIRQRVQDLRGSLDRQAVPQLLEEARRAGRKAAKTDAHAKKGKKSDSENESEGDWLEFVLADAHPKSESWKMLVRLLAMERMLTHVGTTPAVRELIQLHAYFGDLLRIDLQRQIAKLRDKAVPALIEARQHDAKLIQRWANRQLDLLGRAIPGEAVSTSDTQVLADVLRAYGRTRDVDAVRVVLSFCNSDRIQLREAAREAIAAIGEPGMWQLKDSYLGLTGDKPPREWGWDRLARELFALHDKARLAEIEKLMDDGLKSLSSKKYADATHAFDAVLARSPLFERRREMVPAYIARARELDESHRDDTLAMLRKALRLDPKSPTSKALESEIAGVEGALLAARGTPDKFILARAIELDPTNADARATLASLQDKAIERASSIRRYVLAAVVGAAALVAMALLWWRRRNDDGRNGHDAPPRSAA
jgi:tetratricopeptide (TPR) repeat protein